METSQLHASNNTRGTKSGSSYKCLETILRPVLLSMKISGIYFEPVPMRNQVEDSDVSSPSSTISRMFSWFPNRVYCYFVLLLIWFNVVRGVVGLFPFDEGLAFKIVITTWNFQCAINSTIMIVSSQRSRHLRTFFKHWDSLFDDATTQEIGCGFQSPKMYIAVTMILGWLLCILTTAATYTFLFGNLKTSKMMVTSFIHPLPVHNETMIFVAIIYIFDTCAWVFPVVFFSILCRVIRAQFIQFGSCLAKQIDDANGKMPVHFHQLKGRYNQLCQAVAIVNSSFKWLLGLSFVVEILILCFMSYQIIHTPFDVMILITNCFWLFTSFTYILVLAVSSSDVNDAAHCLLDDVFRIGTKDATNEELGQLNLFVSKLTGTSIGFTAIDFFVVTKEFLLTIGSLYVTYFFILFQFKIT